MHSPSKFHYRIPNRRSRFTGIEAVAKCQIKKRHKDLQRNWNSLDQPEGNNLVAGGLFHPPARMFIEFWIGVESRRRFPFGKTPTLSTDIPVERKVIQQR
jgi:hypothetical protein